MLSILWALSSMSQNPCPGNQPVMAYIPEMDAILLFGGYCSKIKSRVDDLWKYHAGSWEKITGDLSPPARSGHAMTYDPTSNRLILFGGKSNEGTLLNDTWAWDGKWVLLSNDGPLPRQSHRLVATPDGILLYGGSNEQGSLSDTWIFRTNGWSELRPSRVPPPRRQHTMAFDHIKKRTLIFGGFDRSDQGKIIYSDTWEFDGKDWILVGDNPELARDHHAMVFSSHLKTFVLFGGYNEGYLGDMRIWTGEDWRLLETSGPSARAGKPGFVEDKNGSLIIFGGGDATNMRLMDFWRFDPKTKSWEMDNTQ